jgi:hypothetical protein
LIVEGRDVERESLFDEQGEGVHGGGQRGSRRVWQGARDASWEHDDPLGAGDHGLADGGVVRDAAIERRRHQTLARWSSVS